MDILQLLAQIMFLNAMCFGLMFYDRCFKYISFPVIFLFNLVDFLIGIYIFLGMYFIDILQFINIKRSVIHIVVAIIILMIFLAVPIYLEGISECKVKKEGEL